MLAIVAWLYGLPMVALIPYRGTLIAPPSGTPILPVAIERFKANPTDDKSYEMLGFSYYQERKFSEAENTFEQAIAKGYRSPKLLFGLAITQLASNKIYRAAETFERLGEKATQNGAKAEAFEEAGSAYWFLKLTDKADESFMRAVYYDPNSSVGLMGCGLTRADAGQVEIALAYFLRAYSVAKTPKEKLKALTFAEKAAREAGRTNDLRKIREQIRMIRQQPA